MLILHLRCVGARRPVLLALLACHLVVGHVAELLVEVRDDALPVRKMWLEVRSLYVAAVVFSLLEICGGEALVLRRLVLLSKSVLAGGPEATTVLMVNSVWAGS